MDKYLSVTLHFSNERIAQFNMHLNSVLNNTAFMSFEEGMVQVSIFDSRYSYHLLVNLSWCFELELTHFSIKCIVKFKQYRNANISNS